MWKVILCALLAIAGTVAVAEMADARCSGRAGRQGFFARRQSVRQGGCGSSMSFSQTHSFQMRSSGGFRAPGTCGPGGCN